MGAGEVDSSCGISSETSCNFELNFGDVEDEDLTASTGDLFATRQTPAESLTDQGDHTADHDRRTHSRKRKMDKEGFVTPATPDIPKSSLQFGLPGHADFSGAGEGECGGVEREEPGDGFVLTQQQSPPPPPQQPQQQQQQQRRKQRQRKQHHDVTEASDVSMSSPPQVSENRHQAAADLFEELAQGTKMLIIQMAQNFRESEEYESVCLNNVESLLVEARDLEDRLRHQKDLLQQRIFMIGRRLSSDHQ
ncbi:uncharacterized protein LOC143293964 [Babylonia areolata]|uniref:uncharacterized protein LOC143293964 n=1 Tax=Babylonia areolata TaxID=304850 RepID=UPI003FCFB2F1